MDDLDEALTRLARAPVPATLDELEWRVLARIASPRATQAGVGIGAITIVALAK